MKTYCVLAGKTYPSRAVGGRRDQSGLMADHRYSRGEGGGCPIGLHEDR